ncbi:MAG: hypothetical protein V9G12_25390 [Microthrixaceae bacterium]
MHHAVAVEHVVAGDRVELRVRTVAQVAAAEAGGQLADDRQIGGGDLAVDRLEGAAEVGVHHGIGVETHG